MLEFIARIFRALALLIEVQLELRAQTREAFPSWRWWHGLSPQHQEKVRLAVWWRILGDEEFAIRNWETACKTARIMDTLFGGPSVENMMSFENYIALARLQIDIANSEEDAMETIRLFQEFEELNQEMDEEEKATGKRIT